MGVVAQLKAKTNPPYVKNCGIMCAWPVGVGRQQAAGRQRYAEPLQSPYKVLKGRQAEVGRQR